MKQLDTYYRALLNYRNQIAQSRECNQTNQAIAQAGVDKEQIEVTRFICNVEEDWILEIEKGLVFIEKAIKEERQFIYSQGEVVPIEKVKHVSRDSVQHLAKHSDMITRVREGEDLIPDKLYSVERLNDYAVYENRFLYMLLCYLRDFVSLRYDKILELSNRYDGILHLEKEIITAKQTVTYHIDLHDCRKNDKFLRENNPCRNVIDRIDLILKTVLAFLATPLMECAAKVAMLKPPITKTNVLKMDNNFKGAVALYDYIIAYDKDGYIIEPNVTHLGPFDRSLAEELALSCSTMSFLTYEYGLDLNGRLKENYLLEEQKRRAEEIRIKNEQLEALKRRLAHEEISPEEYILAMEKHVKLLQSENAKIEPMRAEIQQLRDTEAALRENINDLQNRIRELEDAILNLQNEHARIIAELKEQHMEQMRRLTAQHVEEMRALEEEYTKRIASMKEEISSIKEQWQADVCELRTKCREEIAAARQEMSEAVARADAALQENTRLLEEQLIYEARIKSLRLEKGTLPEAESMTSKQAFDALEKEYKAFERFYRAQWGRTKKRIRKEILNYENLKGQNGQQQSPTINDHEKQ